MRFENIIYYLVWAALFFVMMRFGCGAHVMGHHHHGAAGSDEGHGLGGTGHWVPPEKSTDPVCGKTVETATAKSAVYAGHVYYFCSQACRDKFEAASASYVKPTTAVSQKQEEHHGHC